MRHLEIYLINTFATFVEKKNISRTANALHLTEAAVCQQLKKVESYFPFPLFDRRGPGRCLTERGKELHLRALELIKVASSIRSLAQTAGAKKLRIAIDRYLSNCGFKYWALFDGLTMDIESVMCIDSPCGPELLSRHDLDALVSCGTTIPHSAIEVARVEYAWFGDERLLKRPAVPLGMNVNPSALHLHPQQILDGRAIRWTSCCETDDCRMMIELVRKRKCIALLPITSLSSTIEDLRIRTLPAAVFDHVFVFAAEDAASRIGQRLRDVKKGTLPSRTTE